MAPRVTYLAPAHAPSRGSLDWQTAADLAAWLLEQAHVAVVPGSVFGAPDHLRISFAIGQQRLQEAADRLVGALTGIPAPA